MTVNQLLEQFRLSAERKSKRILATALALEGMGVRVDQGDMIAVTDALRQIAERGLRLDAQVKQA